VSPLSGDKADTDYDEDNMTQFIDDELSEIIDARDYLDDFIGKVI
jgi:hypothetical protein